MTQRGGGVSPSSKQVKLGDNYGDLPTPTRDGYIFCGWRNAMNEYVTANTQYIIIGNEKLTAHWRLPISYLSSDWKSRIQGSAADTYGFETVTITNSLSAVTSSLTNKISVGTNSETVTTAFNSDNFFDVEAYFDDNKKTIVIYSPYTIYAPANCEKLFYNLKSLTSVITGNLNTSKATTMNNMFADCSVLATLDVSKFDTSNVTNMAHMFFGCAAVTSLAVNNFNTSKVTTMEYMFKGCTKLVTANISSFNISKCTSFSSMFQSCKAYTTAVLPSGIVTTGQYMYGDCSALTSVTLPTSCTTLDIGTFKNTDALKTIDFKNVKTINTDAFYSGGLTGALTCPASNIGYDAFGYNYLTSVKFTHTGTITLGQTAFRNNSSLTTVDFLAQGTNFKSNSFSTAGNGVWSGCNLQYVKVTQGNFGKELMAETQILSLSDTETTSSYVYLYVPGYVTFNCTVGCWGWSWTARSILTLKNAGGSTKNKVDHSVKCKMFAGNTTKSSTATEQGSDYPAKYGSLGACVYNSCTKGSSLIKATIYGIGSLDSTEWNKIVSSGYNFRCNAQTYRPSAHATIASNINAYCYPNYLDYWVCQY